MNRLPQVSPSLRVSLGSIAILSASILSGGCGQNAQGPAATGNVSAAEAALPDTVKGIPNQLSQIDTSLKALQANQAMKPDDKAAAVAQLQAQRADLQAQLDNPPKK